MKFRTFADAPTLARAAADDFISLVAASTSTFHVALSGGSTPKALFDDLATRGRSALPWERVHLWWGDERAVPPEHPESNYGMAKQRLIDPLGLDAAQVHRMEGERPPSEAAAAYEAALTAELGAPPVFDLIWLGLGPDSHTASLFPGSPAVQETSHYAVENVVDSPLAGGRAMRITLTLPAIAAARHTRFLVAGTDKALALERVAAGTDAKYPASLVTGADIEWLLDRAAAKQLEAQE